MNSFDPPRHSAGTSAGGRFAEYARSSADVSDLDVAQSGQLLEQRAETLTAGGFVPSRIGLGRQGVTTAHVADWWDDHAALAEFRPASEAAPVKMDTHYASGRRIYRRQYSGHGLTLRMPSVTAVKRAVCAADGASVQVPFSAVNAAGKPVAGWAQVTPTGGGRYQVRVLGASGATNATISAAVAALVEGSRPSTDLRRAGDLMELARQRAASETPVVMQPALSKWVEAAGYDEATSLSVMTVQGSEAVYAKRMPAQVHSRVFGDGEANVGTLVNKVWKRWGTGGDGAPEAGRSFGGGSVEPVSVLRCGECRSIYVESNGHRCTPGERIRPQGEAEDAWRSRAERSMRGGRGGLLGDLRRMFGRDKPGQVPPPPSDR